MTRRNHHAIVGGSAAGLSAAAAMRARGFEGRISVIERSSHLPYERPPLSKSFTGLDHPRLIWPAGHYDQLDVDLLLGEDVTGLDIGLRALNLAGGQRIHADQLLLATGVSARKLAVPGEDLLNVLLLRDLEDARQIAARLEVGGPLVIVGGGFIGLEAAAVARSRGLPVTVVEALPTVLLAALGRDLASLVERKHVSHGVRILTGRTVAGLRGSGAVEEVVLDDGQRLRAATVIVGCGVVPNDRLARQAGAHCAGGVVVDDHGHTSADWVWAAGDVASRLTLHTSGRQRIEHWDVAQRHGTAVGASMAGVQSSSNDLPYFWSDQYGLRLQMYGRPASTDQLLVRPDASPEHFLAFWLRGGRIVAAAAMDAAKDLRAARALIERRTPVEAPQLLDPSVSLRSLARIPASGAETGPESGTATGHERPDA